MISLVIPVYNRANIVGRTLASIDQQTLQPDKVVLVDNNSSDSSLKVITQWAESRNHAVVVGEMTPGAAAARNRGLREVGSDYVMFFDSDDIMPPRHIEEVTAALKDAGLPKLGAFDALIHTLDGRKLQRPYRSGASPMFNQIFHGFLSTQRMVMTSTLIRSIGGWNEDLPAWNDLELGVRLLASGATPARLRLSTPVDIISGYESITGNGFAHGAGKWERSLDSCERALRAAGLNAEADLIDYRRAILAGFYRKEGKRQLADNLMATISHRKTFMKIIALYVAAGGRGVAEFAKIFR